MTPSTTSIAAGGGATSFSRSIKWLYKLSLRRHRHKLYSQSPVKPAVSISGGGTCGFSEAFRRFDADGDGKISSEELLFFLSSAGEKVAVKYVERVVGEFDSDGDGLIDYNDFLRLIGGGEEEDLTAVYEMFAAEEDGGLITPKGLRRALRRLGETASYEQCAAMIHAFDCDGDGVLNYDEFRRMMT